MTTRNIDARLHRGLEDARVHGKSEAAQGRPFEPAFLAHLNCTLAGETGLTADYGKCLAVACAGTSVIREDKSKP
jgi:hypothetical protein